MILMIFVGKTIFHFQQPIPTKELFWWLFMGWFCALGVATVQLYLSMRMKSFVLPIGISVCLCIVGLVCYLLGIDTIFPYSQLIIGLSTQSETLPIHSLTTLVPMVIFYIILFSMLATWRLKKFDILSNL